MSRYPLNLPQQLKQEAEAWAQKQGISLNQFILWATAEKIGALNQQLDDPRFPQVTYRRGTSGIPTPVLRGTGIRVQTVVVANQQWGLSSTEIAAEYGVPVRQVEEALVFYAAHAAEIETHLAREQALSQPTHA
jgi:uncharacterized protein (DUF433 family)